MSLERDSSTVFSLRAGRLSERSPLALTLLAAAVLGYLLGSIPSGLLVTRIAGLGDIRRIGSGNIGATNVLRTGSKGAAALTLVLDLAKGWAAVVVARGWGERQHRSPPAASSSAICFRCGWAFAAARV